MHNNSKFIGFFASLLILIGGLWSLHETHFEIYDSYWGVAQKSKLPTSMVDFLFWVPFIMILLQGGLVVELLSQVFKVKGLKTTARWKVLATLVALSVLYFEFEGCDIWSSIRWKGKTMDGPFFQPYRQNESVLMYWGLLFVAIQHIAERREGRPRSDMMTLFEVSGDQKLNSLAEVQHWTKAQKKALFLAVKYVSSRTGSGAPQPHHGQSMDVSKWLGKMNIANIPDEFELGAKENSQMHEFVEALEDVDGVVVVAFLLQAARSDPRMGEPALLALRQVASALEVPEKKVDDMLGSYDPSSRSKGYGVQYI